MQPYRDWVLHKKHKAISLQHCKPLYELTSWCVDCVFYRGNSISIFLVSHWKGSECISLQNSIITKPLRGLCALWPYRKEKENIKRRIFFFSRAAKTSFIVSDAQKYAYFTPTASNWLWSFGRWENFLPSLHLLLEQLGRAIWLWPAAHMFIRHHAPFFWNNSKHSSLR